MERRIYYIDWVRALGALAVVLIHVFQTVLGNYPPSAVGIPTALMGAEVQIVACRWAVPAFFMVSGRLLLDPKRPLPPRKLAGYIARMLAVLATFGLLFCVIELVLTERELTWALLGRAIANVATRHSWDHMWYVYAMVFLYLLTPALRWVVRATGRWLGLVVVGVGIATLVVPTSLALAGIDTAALLGLSGIFYFLLGYWTKSRGGPGPALAVAGIVSIAVVAASVGWAIVEGDGYAVFMREPESPLIALYSLWVFLLIKRHLDRRPRKGGAIARLSDYSFGIYLVHPLFINLLSKGLGWGVPGSPLPPMAFEVVAFTFALGGSVAALWLLRKVPGLRAIV